MEKQIEKKPCKNCIHYQGCVDTFRKAKQDGEVLLIEEDAYFTDSGDCDFYADKRIYRKQSDTVREIIGEILSSHTPDIDGFFTMHECELVNLKNKYLKGE